MYSKKGVDTSRIYIKVTLCRVDFEPRVMITCDYLHDHLWRWTCIDGLCCCRLHPHGRASAHVKRCRSRASTPT